MSSEFFLDTNDIRFQQLINFYFGSEIADPSVDFFKCPLIDNFYKFDKERGQKDMQDAAVKILRSKNSHLVLQEIQLSLEVLGSLSRELSGMKCWHSIILSFHKQQLEQGKSAEWLADNVQQFWDAEKAVSKELWTTKSWRKMAAGALLNRAKSVICWLCVMPVIPSVIGIEWAEVITITQSLTCKNLLQFNTQIWAWVNILQAVLYTSEQDSSNSAFSPQGPRMTVVQKALAVLQTEPGLTTRKIAEIVGCKPNTLSQSRKFKDAREAQKHV